MNPHPARKSTPARHTNRSLAHLAWIAVAAIIVGSIPTIALADQQEADVCGMALRDVTLRSGNDAEASTLQPRTAGSVKHYANLYESPFDVFAICIAADTGQPSRTVQLPSNTKDCYFAGARLQCSYLAPNEIVPVE